jgi:nitrite reductase (NADH) small subunit
MDPVKIASTDEVPVGTAKSVQVGDKAFVVVNINEEFFVLDNTCPHRGGSLGDGFVEGENITCPLHAWQFDVRTGQGTIPPSANIKSYDVEVRDNDILVVIE